MNQPSIRRERCAELRTRRTTKAEKGITTKRARLFTVQMEFYSVKGMRIGWGKVPAPLPDVVVIDGRAFRRLIVHPGTWYMEVSMDVWDGAQIEHEFAF